MSRDSQELLRSYSNSIKTLRLESQRSKISEDEFKNIYLQTFQELRQNTRYQHKHKLIRRTKIILIVIIVCLIGFYNIKDIYSAFMCNLQEYIYPGLRLLRHFTIPLISLFPSLTEFYDETCLIQNPFFTIKDMDCWPCSSVANVMEVTNPNTAIHLNNAPFIYETEQKIINIEILKKLYQTNKDVFNVDAPKVLVNYKYHITPKEMFQSFVLGVQNQLFVWKFNSMTPARILRQIISRPKIVPKHGQSPERFIILDSTQKPFKVPDTECHYSFILFLQGNRGINLMPSDECIHTCKPLKVELKESQLLWYNWWYWRPTIQSSQQNVTLIAHLGSYC